MKPADLEASSTTQATGTAGDPPTADPEILSRVAQKVYELFKQELRITRERSVRRE